MGTPGAGTTGDCRVPVPVAGRTLRTSVCSIRRSVVLILCGDIGHCPRVRDLQGGCPADMNHGSRAACCTPGPCHLLSAESVREVVPPVNLDRRTRPHDCVKAGEW